jgi:general secretion pathway protein F
MPVYEYRALDSSGKNRSGIIDAESAIAARQKLRGSGIFPVEVKETSARPKDMPTEPVSVTTFLKRVRPGEIAAMTRQLAILLNAGVPLVGALTAFISQTDNPALKRIMAQVKDSVTEGNGLAQSLSRHSKLFSDVYVNMVRAGEASGSLDLVLARLADFSEHQEALKGRLRAALAYPVFMFFIGSIILFFLLTFIVPNITQLFSEMQQTLPLPTLILIGVGDFFKAFWWLVLILLAAGVILVKRLVKLPRGKYLWDELKLRIPVLGGIITKMAMARFGRTLGSLLQSGVPLLSALQIVRNIVNNELIAEAIDRSMADIQAGHSLAAPLSRSQRFPPIAIQMITVGEQSGELENMLHKIADVYERETEAQIMSLTSMLEPVMILVMGLAVGFIVVSILLPIFEMNQMIR